MGPRPYGFHTKNEIGLWFKLIYNPSMKKLFIILFFSLALIGSTYADARNFSFEIKNTKINVRTPDGFFNSTSTYPEYLGQLQAMYPESQIVLAALTPKTDIETSKFSRYMIFSTLKRLTKEKISQKPFNGLKEEIREQQFTLLNEMRERADQALIDGSYRVGKRNGIEFKILLNESTPLGVFFENKNSISHSSIASSTRTINGISENFYQIFSTSIVLIKKKIIFVYIYSDYDSEKDITWIEGKTKELVSLLIKNN